MKKNNISQDSMKKVEFILNQKRDEQTDIDLIIKFQLKIFFVKKNDIYEFIYDDKSYVSKIILKLIDLLYILFCLQKTERKNFYLKGINAIKSDNEFFRNILDDLVKLSSFNITFENKKLEELFNLITASLYSKTEYSLSEFIDSLFFKLAFLPELTVLLKINIFSILTNYYLNPMNVSLDFDEKQIMISEDISLDLIIELFTNEQNEFEILVKSIIILNYGSLANNLKNYNLKEVIEAIASMKKKFRNIQNIGEITIQEEKIITMLVDELNKQKYNRNKKTKKEQKNKQKNNAENNEENKDEKKDAINHPVSLNIDIKQENIIESISKVDSEKINEKNFIQENKNISDKKKERIH